MILTLTTPHTTPPSHLYLFTHESLLSSSSFPLPRLSTPWSLSPLLTVLILNLTVLSRPTIHPLILVPTVIRTYSHSHYTIYSPWVPWIP